MPIDPKSASLAILKWRREHRSGRPGKIDSDEELRAFVNERLETHTFIELAKLCRDKFGLERAPGKTAIWNFWRRIKDR